MGNSAKIKISAFQFKRLRIACFAGYVCGKLFRATDDDPSRVAGYEESGRRPGGVCVIPGRPCRYLRLHGLCGVKGGSCQNCRSSPHGSKFHPGIFLNA